MVTIVSHSTDSQNLAEASASARETSSCETLVANKVYAVEEETEHDGHVTSPLQVDVLLCEGMDESVG